MYAHMRSLEARAAMRLFCTRCSGVIFCAGRAADTARVELACPRHPLVRIPICSSFCSSHLTYASCRSRVRCALLRLSSLRRSCLRRSSSSPSPPASADSISCLRGDLASSPAFSPSSVSARLLGGVAVPSTSMVASLSLPWSRSSRSRWCSRWWWCAFFPPEWAGSSELRRDEPHRPSCARASPKRDSPKRASQAVWRESRHSAVAASASMEEGGEYLLRGRRHFQVGGESTVTPLTEGSSRSCGMRLMRSRCAAFATGRAPLDSLAACAGGVGGALEAGLAASVGEGGGDSSGAASCLVGVVPAWLASSGFSVGLSSDALRSQPPAFEFCTSDWPGFA
mmetsp:Transcript_28081/g.61471  ORF Transcript_28081/g.61471 Transcript_28081/m.61471 type:complete len:340 (+) Transcript_28081:253-1272(+)